MEWYEELGYADELDARLANRTPCESAYQNSPSGLFFYE